MNECQLVYRLCLILDGAQCDPVDEAAGEPGRVGEPRLPLLPVPRDARVFHRVWIL